MGFRSMDDEFASQSITGKPRSIRTARRHDAKSALDHIGPHLYVPLVSESRQTHSIVDNTFLLFEIDLQERYKAECVEDDITGMYKKQKIAGVDNNLDCYAVTKPCSPLSSASRHSFSYNGNPPA